MKTTRTRSAAALSAVLFTGSALAGCTHSGTGSTQQSSSPGSTAGTSARSGTATARLRFDPLTGGKPSHRPVVAVKIDDTANGRPQRGVNQADIVYIEEVEGGLT